MSSGSMADVSLPDEARAAVWRIFGAGESPLGERPTFDLIQPVISKHVPSSRNRNGAISAIRGWFETSGDRRWIKPDMREPVAELILGGHRCRVVGDCNLGRRLDRQGLGGEDDSFSLVF